MSNQPTTESSNNPIIELSNNPLTLHLLPFQPNPHQPKPIIRQPKPIIRQLLFRNLVETPEFAENIKP